MEINSLILKLKNNISNKITEKEIRCVNFISKDEKINYAIPCFSDDIFAEIENKLYQKFPEYMETNNQFFFHGKPIVKFKTIGENKIYDGSPLILCSSKNIIN